jgi:carboxyl-terminal processing protease
MPRPVFRPIALFGAVALLAAIIGAQAPSLDASPSDKLTARLVKELLVRSHLAKPVMDDKLAKQWCRNYIKALDPQKYYFLKADVDGFLAQDTTLDDMIEEGNIDFAKTVFDVFLKRSDERLATALELLKEKPDFTVEESIVDDPDKLDYPRDAQEARERWRKRIKLELLQLKLEKEEGDDAVHRLTVRYRDRNRFFHQFDIGDLLEIYLSAMTTAVDPHSNYMDAKTLEDMMNQQLHLSLEGIGASLMSEDGYAVVKEIIPNGAADKDGRLQPEDKIVAVLKDNGEEIDLVEKKLKDVVRYIRGPKGTKVKIVVIPDGSKERKVYELTRERIELSEQRAKGQVIESKGVDGQVIKIGVISLPNFYGDTAAVLNGDPDALSATQDCRKLLDDFKKQGVQAVLVDLRGNGGGLLHEAITLSGLFIDHGPVVQVRDVTGVRHLDDEEEGVAYDGPLAVLIDRQSASASEIFAGVIKDYQRGVIIGDASTFGKGTVQQIILLNEQLRRFKNLPNLGALKLTIQQFYRANGESTQRRGVTPHVHIPSLLDQADFGEGKMDSALEWNKVEPLPHDNYHRTPPDLMKLLQARSDARRKTNEKFQKQEELFKKVAERKARHTISLNEKKFRAEYVPDDEEETELKLKAKGKTRERFHERKAWEPGFYNDEVAAIVADYVTLGSKAVVAAPVRSASR